MGENRPVARTSSRAAEAQVALPTAPPPRGVAASGRPSAAARSASLRSTGSPGAGSAAGRAAQAASAGSRASSRAPLPSTQPPRMHRPGRNWASVAEASSVRLASAQHMAVRAARAAPCRPRHQPKHPPRRRRRRERRRCRAPARSRAARVTVCSASEIVCSASEIVCSASESPSASYAARRPARRSRRRRGLWASHVARRP